MMARSRRESSEGRSAATDDQAARGTGGFLGQIGLFETGNGLQHGPIEIALAIVAAILIYPVARLIGKVRHR